MTHLIRGELTALLTPAVEGVIVVDNIFWGVYCVGCMWVDEKWLIVDRPIEEWNGHKSFMGAKTGSIRTRGGRVHCCFQRNRVDLDHVKEEVRVVSHADIGPTICQA